MKARILGLRAAALAALLSAAGCSQAGAIGDILGGVLGPQGQQGQGQGQGSQVSGEIQGVSGVNLTTIPFNAIERVEVLLDGASAIYGSDAVAGVINFIVRKDYRGAEATVSPAKAGSLRPFQRMWIGCDRST